MSPAGFCESVRKLLIGKELLKHSFLKSAEQYENEGLIFALFLQKSERVKQERERNAEVQSSQRSAEAGIRKDVSG